MKRTATQRFRISAAWCCFLAVGLLFAPYAEAAWSAHAAACCTKGHCAIPEHHHAKAPAQHADCEHQGGGIVACTMRCCDSNDRLLLASLAFTMPLGAALLRPEDLMMAARLPKEIRSARSLGVLSPPPRA